LRLRPSRADDEPSEARRLRQRLEAYGVRPRKRWGQNFLVRAQTAERIVDAAHLGGDDSVIEIGPGAGALTGLLAHAARRVVAIERDAGLVRLLRDELGDWGKIEIREADVLEMDLDALAREIGETRVRVVGNLPYSITTPIFEWMVEYRDAIASAIVLVQREYAARLAAAAASPEYGSLTVFIRFYFLLEPLFTVPASSFWPRPEVESTLLRLRVRARPPVEVPDAARFFELVRASFGQRRKTLGNALAAAYDGDRVEAARVLRIAGIAAERRGETLTLDDFAHVARADASVRAGEEE
jgi:16S rRNA (adenine1518-N6/adenine1519-N6)-dimethyltransferase